MKELKETATLQGSLAWHRDRLKKITGSKAGLLMGKGRGSEFSKTGEAYMAEVAAECLLPDEVFNDDELLSLYIDEVNVTSKAIRNGHERESEARELYMSITGREVTETGLIPHDDIEGFGSSPDGLVLGERGVEGVIEIKCPKPGTYLEYQTNIGDAEGLKAVKPEYYWQVMSHMAVTGAKWCDFIAYSPFNRRPLHVVRIERDSEEIKALEERVSRAWDAISEILIKATRNENI